ncbi:hypothetical protein TNCV_4805781 [Trichonephila clavipes]|nr:hypothetical protein TNCV_4805781 [Trichonephila clavipes]
MPNIPLPTSRPSTPESSTPCEQLIQIHSNIRKFSLLAKGTEDSLRLLSPYMKVNDPEVVDLFARLKYYQEQHHNAECEIAGTLNDNTTTNDPLPLPTHLKLIFPPPIILKASEKTREHMKVITTAFPNIRSSKLSGESSLTTTNHNTSIDYHKLLNLLDQHHFQYHVIAPKDERPIKVVIKGLPCNTDINDIKSDLTDQGFTDTKVSQLIGRITKQKTPRLHDNSPRNINNAKIFQIKTLSYLYIRVEGYEGTGVTQCYKCNRF